jgi:5'-deoxynucleotidase YfbR-like HD superfamily hydrolase
MVHTVGEHSHGVALLILRFFPNASKDLIAAALYHDLAELRVGDLPYMIKLANPELKKVHSKLEEDELKYLDIHIHLNPYEESILKMCDMVELFLHSVYHYQQGQQGALVPIKNAISALVTMFGPTEQSRNMEDFVGEVAGMIGFNINDFRSNSRAELVKGYNA